jgi:hypothetical protein
MIHATGRPTLLRLCATIVLLCAIVVPARGQFEVSVDRPTRALDTTAFTTFELRVRSTGSEESSVVMTRVANDLPDTAWRTSICSMTICYDEEIAVTEPEPLAAGGLTGFTLHVYTGRSYGDTARIRLRIASVDGDVASDHELVVATAPPPRRIYRIEPQEIARSVAAGDTAELAIWAYNDADDSLSLSVERIDDYFPDASWSSRLCVESTCYDPTVSAPPSILTEFGHATSFTLRVVGTTPGVGRVVLRFNSTRGTEPTELRFTVTVGASSVDLREEQTLLLYPNPARDRVTITGLPADGTQPVSVIITDALGEVRLERPVVADEHGRAGIAVGDLEPGVYFLRAGIRPDWTRPLVIVR